MLYTPDDYNNDNVLKIPVLLYAALLYSMKYYIYIISIYSGSKRSSSLKLYASGMDSDILLLLASIPSLLVIISLAKRTIGASNIIRLLWENSRWLLSTTLLLNALLLFIMAYSDSSGKNNILYAFSFIDIWFLWVINTSKRIKDVLSEFPTKN